MCSPLLFYIASLALATGALGRLAHVTDTRTNITYQGVPGDGIETFLNIPYGQDTGGAGRFLPPGAFVPAHNTIFNATVPGAVCPQPLGDPLPGITGIAANVTDISEDCLNLRVTKPSSIGKDAKLPVMVFIYGGGFSIGQAYDTIYTPDGLVKDSVESGTPVIYVAMNYRIGIFGFADNPLLRQEKALNVGLRDQRLALEWVRDNIEVFGGDPERVTIFGESAGGTSVALQITSFGGAKEPLFHQAISESGAIGQGTGTSYAANNFVRSVNLAGCDYHGATSKKSLECLRSLPLDKLVDIEVQIGQQFGTLDGLEAFGPVVDGDFIPDVPSTLFKTGRFAKVPMIIGWNEDDGSLFTPPTISTQDDLIAFLLKLFPGLSKPTIDRILHLYPTSEFQGFPDVNLSAQWTRASRITRDLQFVCPSLFIGIQVNNHQSHHTTNHLFAPSSDSQRFLEDLHTHSVPIYLYHLNQTAFNPVLDAQGLTFLGISHTADIAYVFDEVARFDDSAPNVRLAKQISGSWSRFATTGVPSAGKRDSVEGWETAFGSREKATLEDARVMVVGGGDPGVSMLEGENEVLGRERLVERCGFLMSDEVIGEIGT